ncbi:MAG: putative transporter permease protein [Paenibacillaceae bacterium]|jgi:ABC-2 type transport system permease protein|nr:putative transporter permease protein [Paenibacillaceae bacterium]
MRTYLSVGKLRFIHGMQYRTAAFAGIATQFFFGFVFIMIFVAFYSHSTVEQPISLEQVVSYSWLRQAFLAFVALWFRDSEIFQLITSGNVAYELCRPCRLYEFWFSKLVGQRLSYAVLRCFPILAVTFFLPAPYRLNPPASAESLSLFVAALLLGLLVNVAISMFIYISVFWTMSPIGSTMMIAIVGDFFSGMLIPVPLMPDWLQQVSYALPFRWALDFPFRVYSGNIATAEALWGILIQAVWIVALFLLGRWALQRSLRKLVVQGG